MPSIRLERRARITLGLSTVLGLTLVVVACSGAAPAGSGATAPTPTATVTAPAPVPSAAAPSDSAGAGASPIAPSESAPADTGGPEASGSTAAGDIPDNAVFLTFKGGTPPFSIQYVEGWQVTPQSDGVVIRDKDSSETVQIVAAPSDVRSFVTSTDIPALMAQPKTSIVKQDVQKVGGQSYVHLVVHQPAPPDPVTGKQVSSTVDRYYVPGPNGLAIVSLSTPNGVDNVDAFRQMIQSFKWT